VKHDKAIFGVNYLTDGAMNELEEFVEIRRRDRTLNDLKNDPPFPFGLPTNTPVLRLGQFPFSRRDKPRQSIFRKIVIYSRRTETDLGIARGIVRQCEFWHRGIWEV